MPSILLFLNFIGYSLFWKYDAFMSVGRAARTLYALACGDVVHQTFLDLWDEGIRSTLFIIIFMVAFFTAFVNIFVAIVMEGFSNATTRKKLDNDDPFP